ncbi:MAG: universal stress protein [Candidatus Binatia bacterium]
MKILVPTAGARAAKDNAEYILRIVATLNAELVALHVLRTGEPQAVGEAAVGVFADMGKKGKVQVKTIVKRGDVVATILETAKEEDAQLIVMGASLGKVVDEWMSADALNKTAVPVVVIPHGIR